MTGECFVYYRFSIVNSCVTVLLLTGFLATILMRVLKNDFLKYTRDDDAAEEAEETGWKYIHGDVFRFPRHGESISFMMLCAIRLSLCVFFLFSLALLRLHRHWDPALRHGPLRLRAGARRGVLPVQQRRLAHGVHRAVRAHRRHRSVHCDRPLLIHNRAEARRREGPPIHAAYSQLFSHLFPTKQARRTSGSSPTARVGWRTG